MTEVAEVTGLSRAAVRRLLLTLRDLGYADNHNDRWRLRPKVLELGHSWAGARGFQNLAQSILDRAAIQTSQSCSIATLDDLDVLFLIRAAPPRMVSIRLTIGSKLPAHAASLGKVLLGLLPPSELEARLAKASLQKFTESTIVDVPNLLDEVAQAREQGYAVVWGEFDPQVGSISMPIRGSGDADPLAVNISVHTGSCPKDAFVDRYLKTLQDISSEVEAALRTGSR